MRMSASLFRWSLFFGLCASCPWASGAEDADFSITPNPANSGYDLSWWGEDGSTYFAQFSTDLSIWEYCPEIWMGEDGPLGAEVTASSSRGFFRLRITDFPTADPMLTDFDSDGITTADELAVGTDPLESSDSNGNGIPDDWEFFYGGYVPPPVPEISGPSLVGHWRLDDLQETELVRDSSQYGRGAVVSAPGKLDQAAGLFLGALEFDSTGDSVSLPFTAWNGCEDFTLSLWIRTNQSGEMTILSAADSSSADELKITIENTKTRIWVHSSSAPVVYFSGHVSLADSAWHHLAVVFDGEQTPAGTETVALYIDGQEIVTEDAATVGPLSVGRKKLVLGQDVDAGGALSVSEAFVGWMDDVRVYDKAVTAAEVALLFGADSDADQLPDHWEFLHFGDLSQDGGSDPDFDGLSNADEFALGAAYSPTRDDLHLNTPDDPATPTVDESHAVTGLMRHYSFDAIDSGLQYPDVSAPDNATNTSG